MKQYRRQAREALKGKWRPMLLASLVYELLMTAFGLNALYQKSYSTVFSWSLGKLSVIRLYLPRNGAGWLMFVFTWICWLAMGMLLAGQYRIAGDVLDGKRPQLRRMFPMDLLWKGLGVHLVTRGLSLLGGGLLALPLLIVMLMYAMAPYLLVQNPQLGVIGALRQSRLCMRGNKWRYFRLVLSFFGWFMLAGVVLMNLNRLFQGRLFFANGFVLFPLTAYVNVASVAFFRDVEAQK